MRDCCFKFLNRSLPIFPVDCTILKPNEQKLIKVKAPFIDEISGLAIVKILDRGTHSTLLIKLKFTSNTAVLDKVNNGTEAMIFRPEEMLGIVDLRSLHYCSFIRKTYGDACSKMGKVSNLVNGSIPLNVPPRC